MASHRTLTTRLTYHLSNYPILTVLARPLLPLHFHPSITSHLALPSNVRLSHFFTPSPPLAPSPSLSTSTSAPTTPSLEPQTMPHYRLNFTCAHCAHPSAHHVSQQAYHHGSVLITCSHCRNRHIISDHLDILTRDGLTSIEDVVARHGRLVKNGTLGMDGTVEFWAEGGVRGDDGGGGVCGAGVGGRSDRDIVGEGDGEEVLADAKREADGLEGA